ncbi:MAG: hypothetical protein EXS16_18595 [Gemmataceae bacterium]|nr:hypothetical protein [Gemmataceae bacterium]
MTNDSNPTTDTWRKPDAQRRRLLSIGCWLFVAGVAIAAYCGCDERYGDGIANVWLKLGAWTLHFVGLVLFLLGLFQSPIRRR